MKSCYTCKQNKQLSEFNNDKRFKDGKCSVCRSCRKSVQKANREKRGGASPEYRKNWRKNNPHLAKAQDRRSTLKKRYGITVEDYEAMLASQDGKCKICSATKPSSKYDSFHVDHCHTTGKIRGLLCNRCNLGIGNFKDSVSILEKAILYLKENT